MQIVDYKNKTFGIPRGLFYWQHSELWKEFFQQLDIRLISSSKTNRQIVSQGVRYAEDESCFSYKVFMGHVYDLLDQVDVLFIPTYKSLESSFVSCPKFVGISDVLRCLGIDNLTVFDPSIDVREKRLELILVDIGLILGASEAQAKTAADEALRSLQKEDKIRRSLYEKLMAQKQKKILLFSHIYILQDEFVNLRVQDILSKNNVVAIPVNIIPYDKRDSTFTWDFMGEEIARLKSLDYSKISGIIQLSSFCCGPDSVVIEYMQDFTSTKGIPFLNLMLDELSGEAGIETRIEAFVDTIYWRGK